jgi:hypothetical protein
LNVPVGAAADAAAALPGTLLEPAALLAAGELFATVEQAAATPPSPTATPAAAAPFRNCRRLNSEIRSAILSSSVPS